MTKTIGLVSFSRNSGVLIPFFHYVSPLILGLIIYGLCFLAPGLFGQAAHAASDDDDRLAAIVQVDAMVPPSARTAMGLGTNRTGTGVVIDDEGLILTIGYVILEAIEVNVKGPDGRPMPANIVAYDHETGFGLIRTNTPIHVKPMPLGNTENVRVSDQLLVASRVGKLDARGVYLVDRRPFAGYWEYLLDEALFTAPAYPQFGGAALIDRRGELVGIGSLIVGDKASRRSTSRAGNMFVPIDLLKPIMGDLLAQGRRADQPHPWLGLFLEEYRGRIFVTRVAPDGPGQDAGMHVDDLILGIDGTVVNSLAEFYRTLWERGAAGIDAPFGVGRGRAAASTIVKSGDRYQYLRLDPTF
ncbi:MAG: S1C family serine protease [Geminicoccaceae bacterium]